MSDVAPVVPETNPRATSAETTTRIARSALMLATLAFLGLALTVGWQLAIAAVYGTSAELDAFWIGAAIPTSIASVFHLGVLTLLFVVVFHMPQGTGGRPEKDRLASSVFNAVGIGTAVVALLLAIAAPQLVRLMGPGLDPEQLPIATTTLRWLTLLLVVSAPLGAMAGILNAFERFAPFAWSRVLGLALQTGVLFVLARTLGVNALTASLLAGTVAMVVACWPTFRKTGFQWSPAIAFRGDEARSVLRMMIALVLLGVLSRGNQIVDRYFASLLGEGAVSALEYGWRFEIPVSQILAFSIALPSFAMMALHAGNANMADFRHTVAASVRLTAILVAPVILFLVVMREPLTVLWFQRGAFSPEAAETVASLIPYLGVMFVCLGLGPVMVFGMLTLNRKAALVGILTAEADAQRRSVLGAVAIDGSSRRRARDDFGDARLERGVVDDLRAPRRRLLRVPRSARARCAPRSSARSPRWRWPRAITCSGAPWRSTARWRSCSAARRWASRSWRSTPCCCTSAGLIHVHFEGLKPVVHFPGDAAA